ncbi:hypothetical protein [Streptomyces sp. NPDC101149]|uniref:hypothetical protein n=1 Tax=Streptomyces sp. NPDC101149 TaxID=3366113 RepID=UPI00381820B7
MERSDPPTPTARPQVATLVARSADLKGELVAFAQSPRFARPLDARLDEAADRLGFLDEATAIDTIDHFALQHRLADGSTVLERFAAQRRPPLGEDEQAMLLGWHDVVEGAFEVQGFEEDAVVLHNLLDDLVYQVHSNLGRRALGKLRTRMFVAARVVPVHPDTDAWLISGNLAAYAPSNGPQLAQLAVQTLTAHRRYGCASTTSTGRTRPWPNSTTRPLRRQHTEGPPSTNSAACPKNSATRTPSP